MKKRCPVKPQMLTADHIQALVAVAAFIGPLAGTILMLQIKISVMSIRTEVLGVAAELRQQIMAMEAERRGQERWLGEMQRDVERMQARQDELTRSVLRCQAFHIDERQGE